MNLHKTLVTVSGMTMLSRVTGLIREFLISAPEILRQAHEAAAAGDAARLGAAAHALAGGCSMLGARHLAASSHDVQRCIDAGDLAGARAALQTVDEAYQALEHTFAELSMHRAA